jgi:16S rRNA (cytidine1402-2'-O)-methyltransferase
MATGTMYLVPCPIAEGDVADMLPAGVLATTRQLDCFLAEDAKSARAFLKRIGHPLPLRDIEIVEIGHAPAADGVDRWLAPLLAGRDIGVLSEAGCPAVADPGAVLVAAAHERGLRVQPLVGPSSLLLALMASGLNGQRFRFHGYLPVAAAERAQRLQALERDARGGETQLFIETPYRSRALFDAIVQHCAPATRLALAVDVTGGSEYLRTRTVGQWRAGTPPPLERRPAVFSLLA